MKRINKICLTLLIAVSALFGTYADIHAETIEWSVENGVLVISGEGRMPAYSYSEKAPWYEEKEQISKIIVNEGITYIGSSAFVEFVNLTEVVFPDSLTQIGSLAFLDCIQLNHVELPAKIEVLEDGAFKGCDSITQIVLPERMKVIGNEAFFSCDSLRSVSIPASVTLIGKSVFAYCESLNYAEVNASIKTIPSWMFYGCESLSEVSISREITDVNEGAFENCGSLEVISGSASDLVESEIKEQTAHSVSTNNQPSQGVENEQLSFVEKTDNAIVKTQITNEEIKVDATIVEQNGWNEIADLIESSSNLSDNLNQSTPVQVTIKIEKEEVVDKTILSSVLDKNVNLYIENQDVVYKFASSLINSKDIRNDFNTGYSLTLIETPSGQDTYVLKDAQGYYLSFLDSIDFELTVQIKVGKQYAYGYASLYQMSGSNWEYIQTSRVDREGYAAFYFKSFDSLTKYLIGMNVDSDSRKDAIIPESLYDDYGILRDAEGNRYMLTGASSRWGISFKNFSLIIFGVLGVVILLVGATSFVFYKMKQNKEKVRREVMMDSKKKK